LGRRRPRGESGCFVCGSTAACTAPSASATQESRKLQIGGLVLGCLSFLHPLIMVGSLILNIRELRRGGTSGGSQWMNVVGLGLTGVGMLVWVVGIALLLSR
jgi:hypothetical protein